MRIFNSTKDLIGNTPLLALKNTNGKVLCKLEFFNPLGSVKDRVGYNMILSALEQGLIDKDTTIIEPTSGNTGIALTSCCACLGMKCILTMSESMSKERIMMLKALGAQIVLTDKDKGMQGAVDKANELHSSIANSFIPDQFSNPTNPLSHIGTANEIITDTDGKVDYFVACIGTGGTISGVGERLKKAIPSVKIVGCEPSESPLISKGYSGTHNIQGIGANFIPSVFNKDVCDEIVTASTCEAYETARMVAKTNGILVGISSGASIYVALSLHKRFPDKTIVALCPDGGEKYLSTPLFDQD